jgi:Protein of unknown function (DUF1553)
LTARVTVNRQWQAFFGQGIVRTAEDFGLQGTPPSHPELLDWLALEFMRSGWSLKQLHRLIVSSATYQQSSGGRVETRERDPDNRWLSRGPSFRLEAELIRDVALQASGLLWTHVGGPSVYPPQPSGGSDSAWPTSAGFQRYRRSLYTYSKRTAPFALFNTFDAPTGESCVPRRDVSNTPIQALTLLNDVVFVEAAQALGRRLHSASGSIEDRIVDAFRRCLTRSPARAEVAELKQFFDAQRGRLQRRELDASAIAGAEASDPIECAAWTLLARALFNLDEMITKS